MFLLKENKILLFGAFKDFLLCFETCVFILAIEGVIVYTGWAYTSFSSSYVCNLSSISVLDLFMIVHTLYDQMLYMYK